MADKGEKGWYIVQTYSGKEDSVKDNLVSRIASLDMEEFIFNVIVPTETVVEEKKDKEGNLVKDEAGNPVTKEKIVKLYPGYVFVEMIDTDESWWVVRNTPGVTGFLGSSGKKARPIEVTVDEMEPILRRCGIVKPITVDYVVGDDVTVVSSSSPFKDFVGKVEAIDIDKRLVTLSMDFLGKSVEKDFSIEEVELVK